MKPLTGLLQRRTRLLLCAAALLLSMLAVAQDRSPASAATTEILPSLSSTAANWASSVYLVVGGHHGSLSACDPNERDAATVCLYIWAKNVDATSLGVGGFEVTAYYDSTRVKVPSIGGSTTWLNRTGRAAACPLHGISEDPSTGSGVSYFSCNTLGPVPPYGPKCPTYCSGILGTVALESKNIRGSTTITFANPTLLIDTPPSPCDPCGHPMPAVIRSLVVNVVPCADMDASGQVLINDITYIIQRYRTTAGAANWDPQADLNGDGTIRITDVSMGIGQYRSYCTR